MAGVVLSYAFHVPGTKWVLLYNQMNRVVEMNMLAVVTARSRRPKLRVYLINDTQNRALLNGYAKCIQALNKYLEIQ